MHPPPNPHSGAGIPLPSQPRGGTESPQPPKTNHQTLSRNPAWFQGCSPLNPTRVPGVPHPQPGLPARRWARPGAPASGSPRPSPPSSRCRAPGKLRRTPNASRAAPKRRQSRELRGSGARQHRSFAAEHPRVRERSIPLHPRPWLSPFPVQPRFSPSPLLPIPASPHPLSSPSLLLPIPASPQSPRAPLPCSPHSQRILGAPHRRSSPPPVLPTPCSPHCPFSPSPMPPISGAFPPASPTLGTRCHLSSAARTGVAFLAQPPGTGRGEAAAGRYRRCSFSARPSGRARCR